MNITDYAKEVFNIEIKELEKVREKMGLEVERVIKTILDSKGKVVVTGIGKSGIIGKKLAATLASTGTLSIFMNSAEGLHGDLGMVHKDDVVLAISNSGNSDEVVSIIPSIKKIGAKLIAMTGNKNSKLGKAADEVLDIGVEKEACRMNLAPTSSTTATLVMGDAIAATLTELRNFQPENFAVYHPGGSLGRRLLMKVKDVMHSGEKLALAIPTSSIDEVLLIMTNKKLGGVCVTENENSRKIVGIITEGDIRRALKDKEKFFTYTANDIMTKNFTSIEPGKMAVEALELMERRESQISILPVVEDKEVIGIIRIHDLLNTVK